MKVIRGIGFNLLGIILGLMGGEIAYRIASWLLISVIGRLGFISNLLSWPVPYYFYALIGVAGAHAFASIGIAKYFSELSKTKICYSGIVVALYGIFYYISMLANIFAEEGFNFWVLCVFLVMISFFVIYSLTSISNECE